MRGIISKGGAEKKKAGAAILAALMLSNIFSAAVEKNPSEVTVSCDGVETEYKTYASTVEDFLTTAKIELKDNDYISYKETAPIKDGMRIVIKVAKYVTVKDENQTFGAITFASTVDEVLNDFSCPLKDADAVSPARYEKAYDGMVINVARAALVSLNRYGSTVELYTQSETVGDFLKEAGVSLTSEQTVTPSADTLITDGMKVTVSSRVSATVSNLDFNYDLSNAKVITCTATAYTPSADETWPYTDGLTATGVKCQVGMVAVDPSVIPLKSKLYIETEDGSFVYGYCTAEDTGGAIKGNKVDLVMNTKAECFNFGRRTVKVYILS